MSKTVDRIAALLAKAERTDNPVEADAYLVKAQQIATLASIDLAVARSHTAIRESRQQPESRTTTIGERGKRANPHLIALFVAIAHANDAHVDIASNSTYVICFGMPDDLDAIDTMFSALAIHMVSTGTAFVAQGKWKGETYNVAGQRGKKRPHTAHTARVGFYRAYVLRISERLQEARAAAVSSPEADTAAGSKGGGLVVLREKAVEVKEFHRRQSKARGSWAGYSGGVGRSVGSAAAAGRSAASSASLGQAQGLPGPVPRVQS